MKRILIHAIVSTLSILLFYCTADNSKSTFYVNVKTGNDRYPGTIKKPLKTISELNKRIQIRPGNIYFAGGDSFEGTLLLNNVKTADSLIISSYGVGRAEIDGGDNEAIRIDSGKFICIKNLYLSGSGRKDGNSTNGLQLKNSSDCVVKDIIADGFRKSGIDLYNCRNVKILKVTVLNNGFCGINVIGSDRKLSGSIFIRDCKAEDNPGDPTMLDNHSGNGILVGVSDSVMIDHCTATNNGWDMPRQGNGPVGIWAWESSHVTIQYCISYRNKTSRGGKDGGGFDLDGGVTNSLIQYCLSYENQGAGYGLFQYKGASPWSNNVIRYCVSINDANTTEGSGSFFIWNGSNNSAQLSDCYIYNNVAYNSTAPVISFENSSDHKNFTFANNIFIGSGKLINGTNKGSRFLGNVMWDTGIGPDPGLAGPFLTEITDPYRLNGLTGYKLKADSPLRNKGLATESVPGFVLPARDFYGNPVPMGKAPEPGIFEMD